MGKKLPGKPHDIVKKGIVHVPEGRKTFSGLTIQDNLLVGGYLNKNLESDLEAQYCRFPSCANGKRSLRARCPAANSRCWRLPAG